MVEGFPLYAERGLVRPKFDGQAGELVARYLPMYLEARIVLGLCEMRRWSGRAFESSSSYHLRRSAWGLTNEWQKKELVA